MFRFTRKPSSGSHSQYLAKITHLVHCGYMGVVQTMSVLWLHSKTCEAFGCSNMFRFTRKPSSGNQSQYLAKITHLVHCGYMEVVQTMPVLWLHIVTCEACVHSTHASQVILCSHNPYIVCTTSMYPQ